MRYPEDAIFEERKLPNGTAVGVSFKGFSVGMIVKSSDTNEIDRAKLNVFIECQRLVGS